MSFESCSWRGVLDTTLCDKVCQWLATGHWFSPGTLVSSTIKNWQPRYNWNVVESGAKNPTHIYVHRIHHIDLSCYVSDCTVGTCDDGKPRIIYMYIVPSQYNQTREKKGYILIVKFNVPLIERDKLRLRTPAVSLSLCKGWYCQSMFSLICLIQHFAFFLFVSCSRLDQHVYMKCPRCNIAMCKVFTLPWWCQALSYIFEVHDFLLCKIVMDKKNLLSFGFLQINYDWIWCVSEDAILIIPLSTYMVLFYRKEMKSLDFPVKVNRHFEHTIHCDFLHTCM